MSTKFEKRQLPETTVYTDEANTFSEKIILPLGAPTEDGEAINLKYFNEKKAEIDRTIPTVDQSIIDGSTNAVSGNAVFDGLAGKADGNAVVKLTGDQFITGQKTFINSSLGAGIFLNNSSSGSGIFLNNSSEGSGIVSNQTVTGTGLNFLGQNNGTNTFTVDKFGATTAQSFIKSGGTSSQFLKADGSVDSNSYALASSAHNPVTIGTANGLSLSTQQLSLGLASSGVTGALSGTDWNTFNGKFNTPTGLTTNYLPKWNGSGFENSKVFDNGTNFQYFGEGSTPSVGVLYNGSSGFSIFQLRNIKSGIEKSWNIENGRTVHGDLGFYNSGGQRVTITDTGNTLFGKTNDAGDGRVQVNGNITASPAVSPNQVVVKSQLDAVAGTSGSYTVTDISSFKNMFVTYTIVGKILTLTITGTCDFPSSGGGTGVFALPAGITVSTTGQAINKIVATSICDLTNNKTSIRLNTSPNANSLTLSYRGVSAQTAESFAMTCQILIN